MPVKIICDINKTYYKWHVKEVRIICNRLFAAVIDELPQLKHCSSISLSILLTDNRAIQELKRQFLQIDEPTNVLSFPHYDSLEDINIAIAREVDIFLGDIAISYQYIEAEAMTANKKLEHHLYHMLLHSILHLCHYDHATPKTAAEMERLEAKILSQFQIADPY